MALTGDYDLKTWYPDSPHKSDAEVVLEEVQEMLNKFWNQSDPLERMNTILAAQRRIDSAL